MTSEEPSGVKAASFQTLLKPGKSTPNCFPVAVSHNRVDPSVPEVTRSSPVGSNPTLKAAPAAARKCRRGRPDATSHSRTTPDQPDVAKVWPSGEKDSHVLGGAAASGESVLMTLRACASTNGSRPSASATANIAPSGS